MSSPDGVQTPESPVRRLFSIRLRCPGSGAGTRFRVCFVVDITTLSVSVIDIDTNEERLLWLDSDSLQACCYEERNHRAFVEELRSNVSRRKPFIVNSVLVKPVFTKVV
jgi:hypothetical protein